MNEIDKKLAVNLRRHRKEGMTEEQVVRYKAKWNETGRHIKQTRRRQKSERKD